jgi:hypothetical protein
MQIGGMDEVRGAGAGQILPRSRKLKEEWLRVVWNFEVVVHGLEVVVEVASEGAHGQIDAVRRRFRGIGYGYGRGIER